MLPFLAVRDKKFARNDTFGNKEDKEWFLGLKREETAPGHSEDSLLALIGQ